MAQGRFEEALAALRAAERMEDLLAGTHAFAVAGRARLIQTQVRMGQLAAARAAIAEISEAERAISEMRAAAATIHLAECDPEHLDRIVTGLLGETDRLERMGRAAHGLGRRDAAERLADLVESHARAA